MGICTSAENREERKKSLAIDRELEQDQKKLRRECKILLLGSGESGKSTIVKQMKIIHQNGYSPEELITWKFTIFKNILESIQSIISAVHKFDYQFETIKDQTLIDHLLAYHITDPSLPFDTDMALFIIQIWNDPIVLTLLDKHSNAFYFMDSAPYFLNDMKRITLDTTYIPTVADVLYARSKTTGITETKFQAGPQLIIHMFDVGGQRSERKKWIHCFEAVTSIIFCVALSEYDQVLLEEHKQNRMIESLIVFESVINSRWFLRTSIVLFLNKIDLFRAKLPRVPLNRFFPDYSGADNPGKAAKYILWRFTQTNRANLNIYPHVTQATDTHQIRHVFAVIKETILQNALKDSGIL
ncbi:small G-protein GPA3 [Mucor mucedo]|uniref:small G-protein GPA3 n=1 Tax=Mucor mucedo TaxID=29922 RepID=UPI00221E953A|nr:small G-protein GPA3 [Mucor mucedo]KAI7889932.1 small G-protein GPA3 [Mucor mucedo]